MSFARSGPVRWFYPCPACKLPCAREPSAAGPVWPEHYREAEDEHGFGRLVPCSQVGAEWRATA